MRYSRIAVLDSFDGSDCTVLVEEHAVTIRMTTKKVAISALDMGKRVFFIVMFYYLDLINPAKDQN